MSRVQMISKGLDCTTTLGNLLQPFASLGTRVWVAKVVFEAGMSKFQNWENTKLLFTKKYQIPYISPEHAAILGTGIEIVLPVFLALGLGARLPALILMIYHVATVICYPFLLTPEGSVALQQHIVCGLLLLCCLSYGPGKLSGDYFLTKKDT